MEIKKSMEADLENDKSSFVLMGLLVALCAIFIAFEYSQRDMKPITKADAIAEVELDEEVAPQSEQNTPPPPPPPPAPEPEIQQDPTNLVKDEHAEKIQFKEQDEKGDIEDAHHIDNTPAPKVEENPEEDNTIYVKVQEKAQYPGGNAALGKFLSANINYPKSAAETGTQGKVIVEFTIEKDGSVSDVKVARSIDPALDKEAMRVVKLMKGWTPAKNGSKKVRCKFRLPVTFQLQ